MTRRRARAAGLALAAVLALAATACNPGRPPAASVDGIDISSEHLDEMVRALAAASPDARERAQGDGDDTYQLEAARQALQVLVERVALAELAEERGIRPGPDDREEARTQLKAQVTGSGEEGSGAEAVEAMAAETRDWLIELGAAVNALTRELVQDPEAVRRVYDETPALQLRCYAAAQVAADDATAFAERLAAGEDFAALAAELNTDPALAERSGDIGCATDAQFVQQIPPTIVAAVDELPEEGGVTEPVPAASYIEGSSDIVYFQVRPPTEAQIQDQISQNAPSLTAVLTEALLDDAFEGVEVRIDPRFGHWDPERLRVVLPAGPSGSTEPAPTTTPPTSSATAEAPPG